MLGLNYLTSRLRPQLQPVILAPGTQVIVDTLFYGTQVGIVEFIGASPYVGEEGLSRAYITGENWSDYLLVDEIDLDDILEADPEYIQWLHDLEMSDALMELVD